MGIYYTNQTIEAYEKAVKEGFLAGDPEFALFEDREPYEWMIKQMDQRIEHNGTYPIWVWTVKPDLDAEGHFEEGTKFVSLTVKIPDEKVLLSDFDSWHCALNDFPVILSEEEEELHDAGNFPLTKEESWERVFDFELLKNCEWSVKEEEIQYQGVTGAIPINDIIRVDYAVAK